MIIDRKENKEVSFLNGVRTEGVCGQTVFSAEKVVRGMTFCQFPRMRVEGIIFEECLFEDCRNIELEECQVKGCIFKKVDGIQSVRTEMIGCRFENSCSVGPFLTMDSGRIEECEFDTVSALGSDGYIIDSVYGKKREVEMIRECSFAHCRVENEDGKLCCCSYFKPFSSIRTAEIDNVDYATCRGVE